MIPPEIVGIHLSDVEHRILEKLSDGKPHTVEALLVWDQYIATNTLQVHIVKIRKKIVVSSYRIHSGYEDGRLVYRLVRTLH